jgi:hypothetical protein
VRVSGCLRVCVRAGCGRGVCSGVWTWCVPGVYACLCVCPCVYARVRAHVCRRGVCVVCGLGVYGVFVMCGLGVST